MGSDLVIRPQGYLRLTVKFRVNSIQDVDLHYFLELKIYRYLIFFFRYKTILRMGMINCEVCQKELSKSSMIFHMKAHSGEKQFACDICNKMFLRYSELVRHKRILTGDKPFSCDISYVISHLSKLSIWPLIEGFAQIRNPSRSHVI